MGHAGAIISGGKGGAEDKIKKMEDCGITMANSHQKLVKHYLINCLIEKFPCRFILTINNVFY